MNQNLIYELPNIKATRFENVFNVYQDDSGYYFYNLLQSIIFPDNLPDSFFTQYVITPQDAWPLVSYRNYDTIDLWWIILLANKIDNPLAPLIPGTVLKIPTTQVVQEILTQLIQ